MKKILDIVNKNELTLANLERSMQFMIKQTDRSYQYRIMHAAFKRTNEIRLKRKQEIAKILKIKETTIQNKLNTTNNPKHKMILQLLLVDKLKPRQIINLKSAKGNYVFQSNRGKKYSVRTIQKIRGNALI